MDARPLSHPGTGIYRYTRELLLRMCEMGGQWYFYSPQAYDKSEFASDNIVHRMLSTPAFLGGSQASQLLFPYWARRDGIELFWGPRHHLPILLPSRINTVLTVHDLVWQKHGGSMRASRRMVERLLMPGSLRRAGKVVTVSEFIASELSVAFPDVSSRLSVIHSGSGFRRVAPAPVNDGTASDYFLFVGTMEPRKNLARLLRAYQSYVQRCPDAKKLRVVGGDGWGGVDPTRLVADLALQDTVQIEGKISDERLAQLYAGAHALVMPSIYEGFGLPVVESLAHGVPAIISRDSALSEVAGAAGYAIEPLSEESICDALLALTLERPTYERLRASASRRGADFDWDRSAKLMFSLLRDWK